MDPKTALPMKTMWKWRAAALCALLAAPVIEVWSAETTSLASLYWCPAQVGRELQIKPSPGCELLVDPKKEEEKKAGRAKTATPVKPENLESAVGSFLQDYRQFIACCANDPGSAPKIDDLEEQASSLLKVAATNLPPSAFLLSRNQALIAPVAQARDRLQVLKKRLEYIGESREKVQNLDYESAARERRKLEEVEASTMKEFLPKSEAPRAATGVEIGGTSPTGPAIGSKAPTGTAIGSTGSVGTDIGTQPPTLNELVNTPPRLGGQRPDNSLTTTKPVTTGEVGTEVGDSSFNNTSRTGPALGDSSSNRR